MHGGGRNIELKARLRDPAAARAVALRLATAGPEVQRQTDTYFRCHRGRLKLREIDGRPAAELIAYLRPDTASGKASDYVIASNGDATALKTALAETLGVEVVVQKRREIFLYHNVRIHLDVVAGLGNFLEFEAVLDPACDDAQGHAQIDFLSHEFGILPADLIDRSYSDLLRV